ncbi:MAG: hypothetical protein JXM69_02325 [Anaerolineae bacterium]|nr:hypothetical protein [Anaerolineae bacterium]
MRITYLLTTTKKFMDIPCYHRSALSPKQRAGFFEEMFSFWYDWGMQMIEE